MVSELQKLENERLHVEENLKVSLNNWEDTFKAISDGVWILDMEGHVLHSNGVFERLLEKPQKKYRTNIVTVLHITVLISLMSAHFKRCLRPGRGRMQY